MGQVRARKRGKTWEYSFETARVNGKRKSFSKGGFRTKAEALSAGSAAKAEYDSGGSIFRPSDISLSDYLDFWLSEHIKRNMAYNTYDSYETAVRLHIKPDLGNYKLASISPDIVQRWVNGLKDEGFSQQSIANFAGVLSGSLNYAVHPCQYIKYNPCRYIRLPKVKRGQKETAHMEYICTSEDWAKIKNRFQGTCYYLPFMIMYHTGARLAECMGLNLPEDYDAEKHTLKIERQVQVENGQRVYKLPKYDSVRTIRIDRILEAEIRKELNQQKKNILRYGQYYLKTYIDDNQNIYQLPASKQPPKSWKEVHPLVRENGEMIDNISMKYPVRIIKKKLGIELYHHHCLRHTHGTILAENGASPKTIMERLGHKNIKVTMERYVYNTEKMQNDAVEIFEAAIK